MAPLQHRISFEDAPEILIRSRPSTATPEKKGISFSPRVNVRFVQNLDMWTENEKNNTWYTRAELHQMKFGVRNQIQMLSSQEATMLSPQIELRGLESFLPEGLTRKMRNRETARNAVLDEQEYQWKNNVDDPQLLADIYFDHTRESVAAARVQGMADESAVALERSGLPSSPSTKVDDKQLFRSGSIGSLHARQPRGFSSRAA